MNWYTNCMWHGMSQQWNCEGENRTRKWCLTISSLVSWSCSARKALLHKNTKIAPNWSGPHRIVQLKHGNNVELKLKTGCHLITHANSLKASFVPLPTENKAEFPEMKTDENIERVYQQDLNQQPFTVTDDFADDEPLPHQHWSGEKRNKIFFDFFEQNALPSVSWQPSSILPMRNPSQTFQPHPLQCNKGHLLKMTIWVL